MKRREQRRDVSAIAAMTVTEDQIAARMRMRDQPSGQLNAIGGGKADILEIQTERGRRPLGHRMQRMHSGDEWDEQNQDDNREGTHKPALPRHPVHQLFEKENDKADHHSSISGLPERHDARTHEVEERRSTEKGAGAEETFLLPGDRRPREETQHITIR